MYLAQFHSCALLCMLVIKPFFNWYGETKLFQSLSLIPCGFGMKCKRLDVTVGGAMPASLLQKAAHHVLFGLCDWELQYLAFGFVCILLLLFKVTFGCACQIQSSDFSFNTKKRVALPLGKCRGWLWEAPHLQWLTGLPRVKPLCAAKCSTSCAEALTVRGRCNEH